MTRLKTGAPMRAVLGFVLRHWRRQAALVAAILAAALLSTAADVVMPIYAGRLVDAVANTDGLTHAQAGHRALIDLVVIAGLGAATVALTYLGLLGTVRLTLTMMQAVTLDTFGRVQRFSADWQANSFAGSTVRQITRGSAALDLLNDTVMFALLPALVALGGSALVLGLRWPLMGALVAVGSTIYVAGAVMASNWVGCASRLSNLWDTRLGGALADAVTCNAVVKAFGAEHREDARLGRVVGKWRRRVRRTWLRGSLVHTGLGGGLLALRTAVTALGTWFWWTGDAGPGGVATVLTSYFVVQGYLQDIGQQVRHLQRSVNDLEELVALHAHPLGVDDAPGAPALAVAEGRVEFERVGFRYGPHATPLFDELAITIPAGQRVGLVGHSGSGKSSFVKLLQRLHDTTSGRILVDGQDIARIAQVSLRQQVAIVPQEPLLFHRSLAENIAYARPGATLREIEHAAALANAHGFIARLPQGYRTLVGERGVKLSGGERQRVAIARAFLADAPILVLDEATASLDSDSEALIQEAMDRLMAGRTAIVIAHRLSTVRQADAIAVVEDGRIVEQGTHDTLLASGGRYADLYRTQFRPSRTAA